MWYGWWIMCPRQTRNLQFTHVPSPDTWVICDLHNVVCITQKHQTTEEKCWTAQKKFFCTRSHKSSHAFQKSPFFPIKRFPMTMSECSWIENWCVNSVFMKVNLCHNVKQPRALVTFSPMLSDRAKNDCSAFSLPMWRHLHKQNVKSRTGYLSSVVIWCP